MDTGVNTVIERKREFSYDLLRAVSCMEVVILHVSAAYIGGKFTDIVSGRDWLLASFWRIMTNLAVPSFVMLSGAFLLQPENEDFSVFYGKSLKKILFPTILFSLIYVLWHYMEIWVAGQMGISVGNGRDDYRSPILNWIKGQPNVTMWYMYMLIGLYLITPVLVMVKNRISGKTYFYLSCVMMVYGILVSYTCSVSWILQFAQWIGYFMLGDVIRQKCREKQYTRGGVLLIILSNIMLAGYWYLAVCRAPERGALSVPSHLSGIIVVCTVMQFAGISVLRIQHEISLIKTISKYSFEIYLIHPFFCEVYDQYYGRIRKSFPSADAILFYAVGIIFLSLLVARGYRAIFRGSGYSTVKNH